jgi:hypothetical protein
MYATLVALTCGPVTLPSHSADDPRPRVETFLRGEGFGFRERGTDNLRVAESYRSAIALVNLGPPCPELVAQIIGSDRSQVEVLLGERAYSNMGFGPFGSWVISYYRKHNLVISYTDGCATEVGW